MFRLQLTERSVALYRLHTYILYIYTYIHTYTRVRARARARVCVRVCERECTAFFSILRSSLGQINVPWWIWHVSPHLQGQRRRHMTFTARHRNLMHYFTDYLSSNSWQCPLFFVKNNSAFLHHVRTKSATHPSPNQRIMGAPSPGVKWPKVKANLYHLLLLRIVVQKLFRSYVSWNLNTAKWQRFGHPCNSRQA